MEYRFLGKTGVKVSKLCFGTMSFGGEADEDTSAALFHRCREVGINFFDCANTYAGGRSEEILGRLAAGHRDELILTSKVYFPIGPDVNAGGATRKHILRSIEASLKRLDTDYLDVYFIHHFDEVTPLEETLRALDDLVHQGKVLYPGRQQLCRLAGDESPGHLRQRRAGALCRARSRCTTWSNARPKWKSCPWPKPKSWA